MNLSEVEIVAGNADLLTEILLWLPAKSLLRFKSVSKEWKSLISSPVFAGLHQGKNHNGNIISGVLLHRPSKSTLEFALLDDGGSHHRPSPSNLPSQFGDSIRILQSCNGLLLCSVRRGPHRRTLHVYNPATGAFSSPPESSDDPTAATWTNLVFDPAESPHHRLICIHNSSDQIHRYSSATGNWTPCTAPNFRAPFNLVLAGGVYWRGSLHWLGPTSTDQDSFFLHVEEGRFGPMPPAPRRRRKRRQSSLESSGGKLLLVEVYEEGEIRVLEMKEDYSGWEVGYEIAAIDGVSEVYPQVFGRVYDGLSSKIYCKLQVCCVVDMVVVMRIPGKVLGYGLKSKRLWEMRDVLPSSETASDFEWVDVFPYVETLAYT